MEAVPWPCAITPASLAPWDHPTPPPSPLPPVWILTARGFHKAWTMNGFGEELCAFVQQLVWDEEAAGAGTQPPKRVLVTG